MIWCNSTEYTLDTMLWGICYDGNCHFIISTMVVCEVQIEEGNKKGYQPDYKERQAIKRLLTWL